MAFRHRANFYVQRKRTESEGLELLFIILILASLQGFALAWLALRLPVVSRKTWARQLALVLVALVGSPALFVFLVVAANVALYGRSATAEGMAYLGGLVVFVGIVGGIVGAMFAAFARVR